jgi:hypothetical protein
MGIDLGDADGDGLLDVYVTNFARETDTLYLRRGAQFLDATIESGLAGPTYLPLGFGCRFLDHDLDGDLDLYVANGHILDNAEALHPGEGSATRSRTSSSRTRAAGSTATRRGAPARGSGGPSSGVASRRRTSTTTAIRTSSSRTLRGRRRCSRTAWATGRRGSESS